MSESMQKHCALVTGATSGIGREVVRLLVADGWRVIGVGRDAQRLADLEKELGADFIGFTADLCEFDASGKIAAFAKQQFPQLDLLVNNAGCSWVGEVANMPDDKVDALINVNLRSLVMLSRNAIPLLARSGQAQIINIGSVAAHLNADLISLYSATKSAVITFTHALAKELAPKNIRVNVVSPTGTDTEVFDRAGVSIDRSKLLPAPDVAKIIMLMTQLPASVDVGELLLAKRFTPGG